MTRALSFAALLSASLAAAAPTPEAQLALMHLRPGERARAEAVLGPMEQVPLLLAELEIDPAARAVTGALRLRVVAGEAPLDAIRLRFTPNAFGADRVKASVWLADGAPVEVDRPEPSLVVIKLLEPLAPGAAVTISARLEGTVPAAAAPAGLLALSGLSGPAGGDHGAFSAAGDVISAVGILPGLVHEGHEGPSGIGDPASFEPANFLVSVTVPPGWRALAPGAALGEIPGPDGRVRFSFGAALVRELPILAVHRYATLTRTVGELTVESHFAEANQVAGKRALELAADALLALEKRLGKLPWKVFRVVEAPLSGGAGGMEFPGLVTISRDLAIAASSPTGLPAGHLLGQLQQQLTARAGPGAGLGGIALVMQQTLDLTVAHEIAHQYFACLVGSDPVRHPAADEPLAQHVALLTLEWTRGRKVADALREQQLRMAYQFYRMTGGEDGPVDRPTSAFANELEYGALMYGKAPLLHDEERKLIGAAAQLAGLRAYVERYRLRWACADCYSQTLATQSPRHAKALRALRRRWWTERFGDEDIGVPDLARLLRGVNAPAGPGAGNTGLPPEVLELLQQYLQMSGP